MKRAGRAILANLPPAGASAEAAPDKPRAGLYAMHALRRLGYRDHPAVRDAVRWMVDHPDDFIGHVGCPWTPTVHLKALWDCRDVLDTRPTVSKGLRWVADGPSSMSRRLQAR